MGAFCSCFRVPEAEETAEPNSSNHENCRRPHCFIENIKIKYNELFGRVEMHAASSPIQGATSSSSMVAPNNTQIGTASHLPNSVNPQNSQLQGRHVTFALSEPEGLRIYNVRVIPKTDSSRGAELNESHIKSSRKVSPEIAESGVGRVCTESEDEDVCPTCFEEYTQENPKISAQCRHSYHLSCIYEWMERSEKCPICAKLMVFDETN